jgi:hypothetical protein
LIASLCIAGIMITREAVPRSSPSRHHRFHPTALTPRGSAVRQIPGSREFDSKAVAFAGWLRG